MQVATAIVNRKKMFLQLAPNACYVMVSLIIDFKFFDKIKEAIEIIGNLEINETSKKGGISALKLILNN